MHTHAHTQYSMRANTRCWATVHVKSTTYKHTQHIHTHKHTHTCTHNTYLHMRTHAKITDGKYKALDDSFCNIPPHTHTHKHTHYIHTQVYSCLHTHAHAHIQHSAGASTKLRATVRSGQTTVLAEIALRTNTHTHSNEHNTYKYTYTNTYVNTLIHMYTQ